MLFLAIILGAVMGGLGRRVAGGLCEPLKGTRWQVPGLVTHLIFALALGIAAAGGILATGNDLVHLWWLPVAVGVGTFVGHSLGLHKSLSMGRYPSVPNGPNDRFSWRLYALHFCGMSAYGLAVLAFGIFLRTWLSNWQLSVGGSELAVAALLTAPIYSLVYLAQDRLPRITRFNLSEWLSGGAYGAACAMMML